MTAGDGGWGRRVDACRAVAALLVLLVFEPVVIGGIAAAQPAAATTAADGAPFIDDPLVAGVTPVRAVHFEELRRRVDALRARAGLPAFPWTDAVIRPGVTPVRQLHVTELRVALAAAYVATRRSSPAWDDAVVTAGTTPIRARHVSELRAAVVALETAPNREPEAVGAVPAQTLAAGGDALAVDVAPHFDDPDLDPLTYEATSSDTGVVTAGVSGSTVTLSPVAGGAATVTVTARDEEGLSASQAISVTVRGPDLVVESPRASGVGVETPVETVDAGTSFMLSQTVVNRGGGASGSTTLRAYRSSDPTISPDDTLVGVAPVSGLAAGASELESIVLAAPDSDGTYYYGGCVEAVGGESDTGNNCSAGVPVTVESPPASPPPSPKALEFTWKECNGREVESSGETIIAVTMSFTLHARRHVDSLYFEPYVQDKISGNKLNLFVDADLDNYHSDVWVGELTAGQSSEHTVQGFVGADDIARLQCAVDYDYYVRPPGRPPPRPRYPQRYEYTWDECRFVVDEEKGETAVTVRITFRALLNVRDLVFIVFFADGLYQPDAHLEPDSFQWVGDLAAGETYTYAASGYVKSTSPALACRVLPSALNT